MKSMRLGMGLNLALLAVPTLAWCLSGGETLREPLGARQVGMGEAFSAFSGDVYALHYNVAGIGDLTSPMVGSMYTSNIFDNSSAHLIMGLPAAWTSSGAMAVSLFNSLGAMMELNAMDGSTETIRSQNDFVGTLGYAQQLIPGFFAGASIKAFHSTLLEKYTANAWAADFGLLSKNLLYPGFNLGACLQNVGSEIKYDVAGDPMPTLLRVGLGYETRVPQLFCLRLGVDLLFPNDADAQQNLGLEYEWQEAFFIRAGYKLGYDLDTFTMGAGVKWSGLELDYAFSAFTIRASAHRLGITYTFAPHQEGAGK